MQDIYKFELSAEDYEKVLSGKKTIQLVINDPKRKSYAVGNQITFVKVKEEGEEEQLSQKAEIENLLYFSDVTEAVGTVGKEKCGFKPSATIEKASDIFLSNENFELIEKFGIIEVARTGKVSLSRGIDSINS